MSSGLKVIKRFSYSTQLSRKFILLINVKMPTIVGILTFISIINTTSERLKSRNFFICWYFRVYKQLKFHAQSQKIHNFRVWFRKNRIFYMSENGAEEPIVSVVERVTEIEGSLVRAPPEALCCMLEQGLTKPSIFYRFKIL